MPWLSVCVLDSPGTQFRPMSFKDRDGSCTAVLRRCNMGDQMTTDKLMVMRGQLLLHISQIEVS
ncbi:hypothetical protein DPMN_129363 [Dreissena polymorpha]|uniref:Uncharacterized protein n=1 Tax=Dreissena polymorpha TaxID=45954 RepID=A0A9D4H5L5_DREPO|nr:hypothetical protein DPMN_129363 [Dreissena polymorpha]